MERGLLGALDPKQEPLFFLSTLRSIAARGTAPLRAALRCSLSITIVHLHVLRNAGGLALF